MASIDFHKLRVAQVKRETRDAVSVRFELPEALRDAFAFKAGQHLTFRRDFNGAASGPRSTAPTTRALAATSGS